MSKYGMTKGEAKEIRSSSFWKCVERECDYRINKLIQQLRTCDSVNLNDTQLRLKLWEEFKNLPNSAFEREG